MPLQLSSLMGATYQGLQGLQGLQGPGAGASGISNIANGTSNVTIATANGNISVFSNGNLSANFTDGSINANKVFVNGQLGVAGNLLLSSGAYIFANSGIRSNLLASDLATSVTVTANTIQFLDATGNVIFRQTLSAISIGPNASSVANGVAIGRDSATSTNAVSIGRLANSVTNAIAIGSNSKSSGTEMISIGRDAGANSTSETRQINLGVLAGYQGGGGNFVAVGYYSGYSANSISDGIAIGREALSNAGSTSGGNRVIAIGTRVGNSLTTVGDNFIGIGANVVAAAVPVGANSIGIGYEVGKTGGTGADSIGIGTQAQLSSIPGSNAIAIGYRAGYSGQGATSIAIGANAGYTNQAVNTIILNASGANLNQTNANTFTVKPIRAITDTTGFKALYYNPTTGEIAYYNV